MSITYFTKANEWVIEHIEAIWNNIWKVLNYTDLWY